MLSVSTSIPTLASKLYTRRDGAAPLEYTLPRGNLVKLLLSHIEQGHKVLTQCTGEDMVMLFTNKSGGELTNVNLVWTWGQIMKKYGQGQVRINYHR